MNRRGLFSDFNAQTITYQIDKEGGTSISNFLNENVRLSLLEELKHLKFTKQPEKFGNYAVEQAFSAIASFGDSSIFQEIENELQEFLEIKFLTCDPYPLQSKLLFSDIAVQRYPPGQVGISAHRDGKSFINLVAVIVLEGRSRFCFCDNRAGLNTRPIHNEAGSLILMRAVGFLGKDIQPFHFVDQITEQRTTFALRQKR